MSVITERRRRIALGILALGMLIPASPVAAQNYADAPQHQLLAASHGVIVPGHLFAYCRMITDPQGMGTGACSDGPATATVPRVPVHRGGSVTIATGVPVTSVTAHYYEDSSPLVVPLSVRPLDASMRGFAIALPATPPFSRLLVSIRYSELAGAGGTRESGSADFSIGLREHVHRVQPTAVTASSRAGCRIVAGGARRCRLDARGTIRRPAGSAADCRGGSVLIRVLAGDRRVLRTTVPTTAGCRYRLQDRSFAVRRGVDRARVETRFLGSPSLAARSAPAVRIDLTSSAGAR